MLLIQATAVGSGRRDVGGGSGGGGERVQGGATRREAALSLVRESETFRSLEGALAERGRHLAGMEEQVGGRRGGARGGGGGGWWKLVRCFLRWMGLSRGVTLVFFVQDVAGCLCWRCVCIGTPLAVHFCVLFFLCVCLVGECSTAPLGVDGCSGPPRHLCR